MKQEDIKIIDKSKKYKSNEIILGQKRVLITG